MPYTEGGSDDQQAFEKAHELPVAHCAKSFLYDDENRNFLLDSCWSADVI